MDPIFKTILIALGVLLPIVLGFLTRGIVQALTSWKDKLKSETKSALAADAVGRILHIAGVVVANINNSLTPEISKALADGTVTAEELQKLKDIALTKLKEIISTQGQQDLVEFLGVASGAVNVYLDGVIGAAIRGHVASAATNTIVGTVATSLTGPAIPEVAEKKNPIPPL